MVMFSSSGVKDSVTFIEETGEFTASLVSDHLKEKMNASSVNAPRSVSEFEYAGLGIAHSKVIAAPYVKEAYAALECVAVETKRLQDKEGRPTDNYMVIGEVVGVHIDESVLTDGLFDIRKAKPVTRLGYMDYATTEDVYQMFRPKWED
jgi:flavin reductase (DIM6/NTAB) family NADH-FMN oxidoreductase RutF